MKASVVTLVAGVLALGGVLLLQLGELDLGQRGYDPGLECFDFFVNCTDCVPVGEEAWEACDRVYPLCECTPAPDSCAPYDASCGTLFQCTDYTCSLCSAAGYCSKPDCRGGSGCPYP